MGSVFLNYMKILRIRMILYQIRFFAPIRKNRAVMTISRDQIMACGTRVMECASLGPLLRKRRKSLGYTQEEVAEMLGFSPRLVGEIERGRGTVGIDKVLSYALALGIDLVALER